MKRKLPIVILLTTAAVCGFLFAREYIPAREERAGYAKIREAYTALETADTGNHIKSRSKPGLPYKTIDFGALLQINPDTVGWLHIPDSPIDYPVVQAANNSKYLGTSFTGERSSAGAVFMDAENNAIEMDRNTVLYAHHITGRTDMFGSLVAYKDREYFEQHKYLQFDTIYERHGWWRVFAVIGHDTRSGEFDYLKLQFEDDAELAEWAATARRLSLHETNVKVTPDDNVLTLSTCDRSLGYGRNGRLLVLAVRI